MASTIAGRTVVDFAVADYLHELLGDEISVEGWEIDAGSAGTPHGLRVHFTTSTDGTLTVIEKLLPRVQGFSAYIASHKGEPGGVRISAALLIDVVELISRMTGRIEKNTKE